MKIAIIGSGISGLGSLYYLSKKHEVDLYEIDSRLGGHTETHSIEINNRTINVDTGFIVCNDLNYPNIIKLFKELNVELHKTAMSYSFSSPATSWSSNDFDNWKLLFKPSKLRLLIDIIRFNHCAKKNDNSNLNLNDWLDKNKFSKKFVNSYVLPMAGAIWSSDTNNILDFPASTFLNFFKNHGLLKLINRPQWFSISNGSKSYIEKIISNSSVNNIYLSSRINIVRENNTINIYNENINSNYDKIIFACHADQVEKNIKDISELEKEALNLFDYNKNRVVLHTDESLMPESKVDWTAWNSYNDKQNDYVTYWMNELQDLNIDKNIFVTLGKFKKIDTKLTIKNLSYDHISYSFRTLEGQEKINKIQGLNNTYYAGAHLGYGFHEDGLTSALKVSNIIDNE
jgi:predicted NAD/FAD-binding protein